MVKKKIIKESLVQARAKKELEGCQPLLQAGLCVAEKRQPALFAVGEASMLDCSKHIPVSWRIFFFFFKSLGILELVGNLTEKKLQTLQTNSIFCLERASR